MKLGETVWSLYTIEVATSFSAFMIAGWKKSNITTKLWRYKLIKYMNLWKVKENRTQVKYVLYSSVFKKHSRPSPINDGLYHLLLQSLYDILKLIHDIFQSSKGFILKSTFTNLFPHLFNGVHLWCLWRNKGKANISRNL